MKRQEGVTVWFTGLSSAGKTTVARELEKTLKEMRYQVQRLDGDDSRKFLSSDLGFSKEDRDENIRRNAYVAKLLTQNGIITLCSFVSPYREAREEAKKLIGDLFFVEVHVNAPLEVCEERDVKGLYAKARRGEIPNLTGVNDPYEAPENPQIELRTDQETIQESVGKVISYLEEYSFIRGLDKKQISNQ